MNRLVWLTAPAYFQDFDTTKITDITTTLVNAGMRNWIFVRVDTDQPGLFGIGEATLEWKTRAIVGAIEDLKPLLLGRDPRDIERCHQTMTKHSFWRLGVIGMTAVSGIDIALWDIAAKELGVPVWRLLGGRTRDAVRVYTHLGMGEMNSVYQSLSSTSVVERARQVARRARAFDMTILYHNRRRLAPSLEAGATYFDTLEAMLPHCGILSLHLPGGDESGVVMTRQAFDLLPRGAVFVNTARGSLVDEEAMVAALRSGRLFGAGLDVFQNEPDFDRRIAKLPNVFLTPHMASATTATRDAMGFRALDNVAAVLGRRPPLDPV